VLTCVFVGCTGSSRAAAEPTPPATPINGAPQVPPVVPHPTDTAVAAPPSAPATPLPTPNAGAANSACEGYVAVLSGKKQDKALLATPEVQKLAAGAQDLVACGAVMLDSDEFCKQLGKDKVTTCRDRWSIFHELRAHPDGRGFIFTDFEYETCRTSGPPA